MMPRPALAIEGRSFSDLDGFYDEVGRKLFPGSKWGRNLDAFDDALRGGFGTPEEGFLLVWKDSEVSRRVLGYEATVRELERRLGECHPSARTRVESDLAQAQRSQGPTIFDWLIEIIEGHESVELQLR